MDVKDRPLDCGTAALLDFAAAIAAGDTERMELGAAELIAASCDPLAVDELLLQSVLTVGWPRALVAAGVWRRISGLAATAGDAFDYANAADWMVRGETTCQVIYGDRYPRLREHIRNLHPALEAWMIAAGYGRTLSRPGLTLRLRELCTVVQTAVLCTPLQLLAHLRGAAHVGATPHELEAALELVRPLVSLGAWREVCELRERAEHERTPP